MSLAWPAFMQFEATDYPPAGIECFHDSITASVLYRMFLMGV